jgi:signal peptidase I
MRRKFLLGVIFILSITLPPSRLAVSASPGTYVHLVWLGGSMVPTLAVGDVLTVETTINVSKINAADQPDGDIIAFYRPKFSPDSPDTLIVHRAIIAEYNASNGLVYFQTKGDANPGPDVLGYDYRGVNYTSDINKISEKLLLGKVVAFQRSLYVGTWDDVPYNVTVYTNSTFTNLNFNQTQKQISFDITGYISHADTGFFNVTFRKNLLWSSEIFGWQVRLNGTNIPFQLHSNDTHTYVYFTHGYSTHHVQIIGTDAIWEFPAILVLPLLMIATASAIMLRKLRAIH